MKNKKIIILLSIISLNISTPSYAYNYYSKTIREINAPQLSIYETTNDNGVKVIKVDAWDNDGESGIWKVEFPTGEFVYPEGDNPYSINTEFYPDKTGDYTFKAYDKDNNVTEKSIHVIINDALPGLNIYSKGYNVSTNTETIQVDSWVESGGANLSKLELPDGSFINADASNPYNINYTYNATTSGLKTFKVYDVNGRYTVKSINTKVDEHNPNLEVYLSNSSKEKGMIAIKIDAWDAYYDSGISRVEISDGTIININNDDQYAIGEEYIPSTEGEYTIKAYDRTGKITEKSIFFRKDIALPMIEARAISNDDNSYTLEFDTWTENNAKLSKFKLPDNSFLYANEDTYSQTIHYNVTSPGYYSFTAIDEFSNARTITLKLASDGSISIESIDSDLEQAKKLVELAETNKDMTSINDARDAVNNLTESFEKDLLQDRLNSIIDISDLQLERKTSSANVDIYIQCENLLSMSLNTNSITFENYSGVEDLEKLRAIEITINSSLPYDLNAYLESEIQNSDKSETIDIDLFNIKDSSDSTYQTFENTTDKVILKEGCPSGNYISHNIDLKLMGSDTHRADVYKTTIKFEAIQK